MATASRGRSSANDTKSKSSSKNKPPFTTMQTLIIASESFPIDLTPSLTRLKNQQSRLTLWKSQAQSTLKNASDNALEFLREPRESIVESLVALSGLDRFFSDGEEEVR